MYVAPNPILPSGIIYFPQVFAALSGLICSELWYYILDQSCKQLRWCSKCMWCMIILSITLHMPICINAYVSLISICRYSFYELFIKYIEMSISFNLQIKIYSTHLSRGDFDPNKSTLVTSWNKFNISEPFKE